MRAVSSKAALNDSFFCNKEYDELYKQQSIEVDPACARRHVKKMQKMIYDDTAYIVTLYYDYLQAYNSDFTGFVPQPRSRRCRCCSSTEHSVTATSTGERLRQRRVRTEFEHGLIIGGIAVAAMLVGGVVFLVTRGRRNTEDVE